MLMSGPVCVHKSVVFVCRLMSIVVVLALGDVEMKQWRNCHRPQQGDADDHGRA
jgi:hypothetical protein